VRKEFKNVRKIRAVILCERSCAVILCERSCAVILCERSCAVILCERSCAVILCERSCAVNSLKNCAVHSFLLPKLLAFEISLLVMLFLRKTLKNNEEIVFYC
jgi:hypothetical protein